MPPPDSNAIPLKGSRGEPAALGTGARADAGDGVVRARPDNQEGPQLSIMLSWQSAAAGIPAALLEAGLVLAPRAGALQRLSRLRSPLWTALLPGSIVIGTFGLLAVRWMAPTLLVAAAVTTPILASIAVLWVVRARPLALALAPLAVGLALGASGRLGQVGTSVIMALACLAVGVVLQRLIPRRWLLLGVVAMAVCDVALLASPFGHHQTMVLAAASNSFHGPRFTGARVGGTTIGYPDLFLAALLGASLAGSAAQRHAAAILAVLVVGYDSMLHPGMLLPATVPIAATLIIVILLRRRRALRSARGRPPGELRPAHAAAPGGAGG